VEPGCWQTSVSVFALLPVGAACIQAWRLLEGIQDELDMELKRLHAAQGYLSLIRAIHEQYPLKELSQRRRRRRFWVSLRRFSFSKWLGFAVVLLLGAGLAMLINLLRIPWARVFACISQSASGGSWPSS